MKDTEKTFLITDGCVWEMNKQNDSFKPHSMEVVDVATGQVRYIKSGSHIRFIDGEISPLAHRRNITKSNHECSRPSQPR